MPGRDTFEIDAMKTEVKSEQLQAIGEANNRNEGCLFGAFLGDALSMPVHWYYDRGALARDYGKVTLLVAPKNPHADSILWRSRYEAPNSRGEILHDQAKYWGQRGIHYHQFLRAGENTLNLQLALELMHSFRDCSGYDSEDYLRRYIDFLIIPGRHRDTYLEECHRIFFTRYAEGKKPHDCGSKDIHIGGLASVPPLAIAYAKDCEVAQAVVQRHVRLTHRGELVETAAKDLTTILHFILQGCGVRESIEKHGTNWIGGRKLKAWATRPDEEVIGRILSPACYLEDAFPASLFLAWKYADDLEAALVANANLGGDNCHRGVVVGALVGASGVPVPRAWKEGLLHQEALVAWLR